MIALICAGYGKMIAKDWWRSLHRSHIACLTQLVTWGYTPSEVEQIILESANDPKKFEDEVEDPDTASADTTEDASENAETFEEVHVDEEEMMAEELAAAE